jgi:hypothetical protein
MISPTIDNAKRLATDTRSLGSLILTFGDGQYAMVSYGMTRPLCDAMRTVNNQIGTLIDNGTIVIPDALRTKGRAVTA